MIRIEDRLLWIYWLWTSPSSCSCQRASTTKHVHWSFLAERNYVKCQKPLDLYILLRTRGQLTFNNQRQPSFRSTTRNIVGCRWNFVVAWIIELHIVACSSWLVHGHPQVRPFHEPLVHSKWSPQHGEHRRRGAELRSSQVSILEWHARICLMDFNTRSQAYTLNSKELVCKITS